MLNQNIENFSQRLILGDHHFISSSSIFKRAMLTGYLSIMVIGVSILYILSDLYLGLPSSLLIYLTLINFAVISFFLNRSKRYEFAKILLLTSALLVILIFSVTDSLDSGIYFNFFPLTVAAFALFDFKAIHKGIIFTLFSTALLLAVFYYDIPILPKRIGPEESEISNFLLTFLISIFATVLVIIFLIKLNHTIESNLINKDKYLIKTTEELKSSKQRFELAISGSNAGIYDWDIQNNEIYHSPMWKQLLGFEPDELNNFSLENYHEIVYPEDQERAKFTLESHLADGSKYGVELRLRTKNGEYQWFTDSGQAVWNEQGVPVRMVGSIIKIHARKIAEERIKKQNKMLEKANLELDNFVYSTSHDIRSPLTSILGLINIGIKSKDKAEIAKCFNLIESRVHRLDEFIEDINDFSRNMRVDKKLREINLYYFIEDIFKNYFIGDQFEHIDVRLSLPSNFEVISDPLRLKIIIKNILSNASKFSNHNENSAWLRISALKVDGSFQIIVEDNGEGIREEYQGKIYNMFYRASEKSTGSGLGLYIAKEMVTKLNGTIKLKSVYGEGSQFIIELPDHNFLQNKDISSEEEIEIS